MTSTPQFFTLTPAECRTVLQRNHVGRIAYRVGTRVDIQPLGYVSDSRWLFIRSAYGSKLDALIKDPFVALEVDEIEGPFDWRSVVVHGTIYLLDATGGSLERQEAQKALAALRALMPEALTPADPVPERRFLYGLNIQEVSGRMATSRPDADAQGERVVPPAPRRHARADAF
jgi:hypothetical protein